MTRNNDSYSSSSRLNILHLEDSDADRYLAERTLKQSGLACEIAYAKTRDEFLVALCQQRFDLVLVDHALPGFDGVAALEIVKERSPELPVIFVTGSIGEEKAIEIMKRGATDYVLKDRFTRLIPAVKRALEESAEKKRRARAEKQIGEQAMLLDKASDGIIVTDLEGRIAFWNQGAERLYGWSSAEALGKTVAELLGKTGSARVVEAHQQTARQGEWAGELLYFSKAGKVVISDSRWTLVRTDSGEPRSLLSINADITEKKQLEAQYLRAQRMETVGILAGGIAHDLNNVLSPILLASQLIRLKNPGPEISDLVETLETSAKHGTELIKQILSFARGLEGQHIEVQVAYLIRDLQKMLKETLPRSIQLQTEIPANLWLVKGVPTHIEQVLMNLAVNAKHAMPEGGKISISAKNTVVDQSYARLHPDAKAGTYVVLSVNDTGTGMSPETLKHIYDPFFTTKPGGKGSGLGLSTVKSIVKNHGGFVHVYSEMGKGTTFRAYFPATASIAAEQVSGPQVSIPRGNGERILVVDDEAAILRVTKTMLERNGYAVETANDGAEGIATFVKHRNDIRLVITDVMMPVMDGLAMVQTLLKLKSDIKVLAVSGLIESHKAAELSSVIKADILQKPFTSEELLTAVHRAMEQGVKEP